jgi:hypothetical protein
MIIIPQSSSRQVTFFVEDSTGAPVTGKVSGDFTKFISKNGGAFASMTVTVSELAGGWYTMTMSTTHTNTVGPLAVYMTASGAMQTNLLWQVEANALYSEEDARILARITTGVTSMSAVVDSINTLLNDGTTLPDALLGRTGGVETGLTVRQCLRLLAAILGGKISGAGTGSEVFRNAVADNANRVTVTGDVAGNRSAVTYNL